MKTTTPYRLSPVFLFVVWLFSAGIVMEVSAQTSAPIGGYPMPSLQAERDTYTKWGWTWDAKAEPNLAGNPTFEVRGPDIHGDTEGDDLWNNLMMYFRTGQQGYLDRAKGWARYFKEDYRLCKQPAGLSTYYTFCADKGFLLDHIYGWGLVAWYEYTGDAAALAEAENLLAEVDKVWKDRFGTGQWPKPGEVRMANYGPRGEARHLMLATRVAEVTKKQQWIDIRDRLIALFLASPDWDTARGTYFMGGYTTDYILGTGAWERGERIQSPFQLALLVEAFAQAYRVTGNVELKNRVVAIARYINQYGLDQKYQYAGSFFGIVGGKMWHNYGAKSVVDFWDPYYTASLVNTLMYGCKFSGDQSLCDRAKYFFNRGTKGIYGQPTERACADDRVCKFIDSRVDGLFIDPFRGFLQYTYLIFEGGGTATTPPPPPTSEPTPEPTPEPAPVPDRPTNLQIK
ncbi:MAG: hypothetical protein AB7G75_05665 [Candidatus Binatia bacterium]